MDASSYLRKQGWRGDGHSLDHTNRGIKKPLLVSKKVDVLGVGLNKHTSVSDQWWLRAFDQGLKNFGTGKESALAQVQKHGVSRGGLYANFIKGEKMEGSIGNTPNDTDGTNTPVEIEQASIGNIRNGVPSFDQLECTVGRQDDKNGRDPMMHILQTPQDAPASMDKISDRKRKRDERPVEKRARRKLERAKKSKEETREARRQAKKDGTWDVGKEEERRQTKLVSKRASEFIVAAQQLGYIPAGSNEIRKGVVALDAAGNIVTRGQPTAEQQRVFALAGLDAPAQADPKKSSAKQDKCIREKMKRELKRAAKTYLKSEKPASEMTEEESKAKKEEKCLAKAAKKNEAARKEAQKMANREERAVRKKEKKAEKKVDRVEVEKILAERKAAGEADEDAEQGRGSKRRRTDSTSTNGAENGANEHRFGMNSERGFKKVPGFRQANRYPTKAQKKAKDTATLATKDGVTERDIMARLAPEIEQKEAVEQEKIDRYRAVKHGITLEQWRAGLANGEVFAPTTKNGVMAPEKLAEYQKRADEKGVSLKVYIRRREEKSAAKLAQQMGNLFQSDIHENGDSISDVITAYSGDKGQGYGADGDCDLEMADNPSALDFVIDSNGDVGTQPTPRQKVLAITAPGKPLAIVDTLGDDSYTYRPNMPAPVDPRVWKGKGYKKKGRATKDAAVNAGSSGSTDRARLEVGYSGNREDLLL